VERRNVDLIIAVGHVYVFPIRILSISAPESLSLSKSANASLWMRGHCFSTSNSTRRSSHAISGAQPGRLFRQPWFNLRRFDIAQWRCVRAVESSFNRLTMPRRAFLVEWLRCSIVFQVKISHRRQCCFRQARIDPWKFAAKLAQPPIRQRSIICSQWFAIQLAARANVSEINARWLVFVETWSNLL